jgi:hypothetical protein
VQLDIPNDKQNNSTYNNRAGNVAIVTHPLPLYPYTYRSQH